jgi:hypothetical protein
MAATEITAIDLGGALDYDGTALTWTAADASNGNEVTCSGREIILCRNDDASAHDVTVTSVNDPYGRTKDQTKNVAAGDYHIFGPFPRSGWETGGLLSFSTDNASVFFAVLRLPASWTGK